MTIPLTIPQFLLPKTTKFGCGPSVIRHDNVAKLVNSQLIGTSHRQAPVKKLVGRCQALTSELFSLPDGYQVVLGNGGATTFWAVATASLIKQCSAHAVFGSFGAKFAATSQKAPFLDDPSVTRGGITHHKHQGTIKEYAASESELAILTQTIPGVDAYCWPHHETSTGVISPVQRVADPDALMLVDATSIAGGIQIDLSQTDVYYYSLQKCFASDGGLWVAIMSPAAQERAAEISQNPQHFTTPTATRWIPEILDLSLAIDNSKKQQTLNTPAIATLELWAAQLEWLLDLGGLSEVEKRTYQTSQVLYEWADSSQRPWVCPYVTVKEERSPVVVTLDFAPEIDTTALRQILRENGIVDLEPYRSLGRNQIRCSCFPSIGAEDTQALTQCLDYVIERL